jgi:hypothetical protein
MSAIGQAHAPTPDDTFQFALAHLPPGYRLAESSERFPWRRSMRLDLYTPDSLFCPYPSDGFVVAERGGQLYRNLMPDGWLETRFTPIAVTPVHLLRWLTATANDIAADLQSQELGEPPDPYRPGPWQFLSNTYFLLRHLDLTEAPGCPPRPQRALDEWEVLEHLRDVECWLRRLIVSRARTVAVEIISAQSTTGLPASEQPLPPPALPRAVDPERHLSQGAQDILAKLVDAFPAALSATKLATATGNSRTSVYRPLDELQARGLVTKKKRGHYLASEEGMRHVRGE